MRATQTTPAHIEVVDSNSPEPTDIETLELTELPGNRLKRRKGKFRHFASFRLCDFHIDRNLQLRTVLVEL